MGVFSQPEWSNFVHVASARPWQCFGYVLGLSRLVLRRFSNALHIKLVGKGHRGLKRWPEWLAADTHKITSPHAELAFPEYSLSSKFCSTAAVPKLHFEATDAEGYFALHRWGDCFSAALDEEAVAASALKDALSWICNPPVKQDAAWETYSSSERVANLCVMLSVHSNLWRNLETDKKKQIEQFLIESASWITNHLEYYGINNTNNHILNNARALVIAGAVLGNELLVERGLVVFSRMADELFQSGGFLRERSSHYQCVVTNWLQDTVHFSRSIHLSHKPARIAREALEELSLRVSKATGLLITAMNGMSTIHIGDISPDSHPAATVLRLRCLYSDWFQENQIEVDGYQDDWLFAADHNSQLIMCGMPTQYPFEYATHGHSDLGSFVWGFNRHSILVDAGRASYVADETTKLQCSQIGHNTLAVNGLPALSDSLLTKGIWRPKPYCKATVNIEQKFASGFIVTHDGFSRILGVKTHTRSIQMLGDGIEITDTLLGSGKVEIELYWHFASGLKPHANHTNRVSGIVYEILIEEATSEVGDVTWLAYPFSAAYGKVESAYMRRTKYSVSLPWSIKTKMKVMQCAE